MMHAESRLRNHYGSNNGRQLLTKTPLDIELQVKTEPHQTAKLVHLTTHAIQALDEVVVAPTADANTCLTSSGTIGRSTPGKRSDELLHRSTVNSASLKSILQNRMEIQDTF